MKFNNNITVIQYSPLLDEDGAIAISMCHFRHWKNTPANIEVCSENSYYSLYGGHKHKIQSRVCSMSCAILYVIKNRFVAEDIKINPYINKIINISNTANQIMQDYNVYSTIQQIQNKVNIIFGKCIFCKQQSKNLFCKSDLKIVNCCNKEACINMLVLQNI